MKSFLVLCIAVILFATCQKDKLVINSKQVSGTVSIDNATKAPITQKNFNTCMTNNTSMLNTISYSTKPLDKAYSDRLSQAKTESEARSILLERFTTGNANLLLDLAKSNKSLTTNISNTQNDWNTKVNTYTDTAFGWTAPPPPFEETCEQTRDDEIRSCDHTEWFLGGISILFGFVVPWVGIAGTIETTLAHESCVNGAISSYDKCKAG